MKLTFEKRYDFDRAAERGHLFFWSGGGACSWINTMYQRRMRPSAVAHFDHVGVVGDEMGAYESTLFAGPSRNRSVGRYLDMDGHLMIAAVEFEGAALDSEEIERGLSALIRAIQKVRDKPMGLLTYDWLSLVSMGRVQMSNRMICSELARVYLDEALRMRRRWNLSRDCLVLPDDLSDKKFVRVVWDSEAQD